MKQRQASVTVGTFFAYYGVLALVTAGALVPSLWVILSSLKTGAQIYSSSNPIPQPPTLQGYIDAFSEIHLQDFLANSLTYAVGGTIGAVTVAVLAAYPTARLRFPFRSTLVAAFSLPLAIPVVGLATPEFFIVEKLGLYDSRAGLLLFYIALFFPLSFVILRAFLQSLPTEMEEAARVDGAGYFTLLRRVILPVARPGLATVAVVVFIGIWNEFFFANLLTTSIENESVQLALATFRSQFGFNVTGLLAGTTVIMLVPVGVFLVLQRQVIAGLSAGSTR